MASTHLTMNQRMFPLKSATKWSVSTGGTWSSKALLEQKLEGGKEGKE